MRGVSAFDTFGAWYLARLARDLKSRGHELTVMGLAERYTALFDAVQKSSARDEKAKSQPRATFSGLAAIGGAVVEAWLSLLLLLNMLGAVCAATLRALRRPSTFRLTSTVHHVDRVAWQAIPIILLITFLIGGIIAQQGFFHFRKFGAEDYVVDMVGILVLREIGVLIVAIMVAGRSGSSYTAELGSMKMREEIDALRTMGFNPVDVLILPRVVALVIGLPILTFIGSISALYGGELVAWLYGGMSPDIFVARLKEAISITHFKVGLIKALGGTKGSIRRQFLYESIIISLMGAVFGVILGVILGNGFSLILNTGFVVPWDWVALGIMICTIVGLLAGLYPAFKASRLNPIEALRYE